MEFEARVTVPSGYNELTLNYRAFAGLGATRRRRERIVTAVAGGTLTVAPRNGDPVARRFFHSGARRRA